MMENMRVVVVTRVVATKVRGPMAMVVLLMVKRMVAVVAAVK